MDLRLGPVSEVSGAQRAQQLQSQQQPSPQSQQSQQSQHPPSALLQPGSWRLPVQGLSWEAQQAYPVQYTPIQGRMLGQNGGRTGSFGGGGASGPGGPGHWIGSHGSPAGGSVGAAGGCCPGYPR